MQKRNFRTCRKALCGKAWPFGKIISFLLAFFLCAELSAHSGMMWGEKNLRVTKTKWFDLIYPERSAETAAILYEKADTVYEEVTAEYGLEPFFRMPVVITPAVDQFNAFWTAVPYNHIALYDTGSSGASELAVFSETMLSTFRHELTHAVTYNMKNGFWRFMGHVFGDCVTPGMLSVTTGMAEGATVAYESSTGEGEGRLNDEYAMHSVKQAKIENKFPAYHDVSGAADVAPGGAPYYFNGAFHGWLQEKYGLEPYAQFWYRVVNGKNITISGAFKKAFGLKLTKAWKQFIEDFQVPDVAANPVKAGLVQDFFEPSAADYSMMNNAGSQYDALTAATSESDTGRLVWLDSMGGRVFSAESDDLQHYRQLFSHRGITDINLSNDGRFLALSYMSGNGSGERARIKLYDFDSGSFYSVKETGIKEGAVVKSGSDWYLLAQKYLAQHYSIVIFKLQLSENGRHVKETRQVAELTFGVETNPYAFTPLDDGTFAYLKKQGLNYSLCMSTIEGQPLAEYAFPKGMAVRSLSYNSGIFYFSYAQKGTLPRLGKMQAANGQMELSSEDISGGVFAPVYLDGKIIYIGSFLRQSRILCMNSQTAGFAAEAGESASTNAGADTSANSSTPSFSRPDFTNNLPSKGYNPFPYITKGIFIPLSNYSSNNFGPVSNYTSGGMNFCPGGTFVTANPWTEGASDLFQLTCGYYIPSNSVGTTLTITQGTATNLFRTKTQLTSEFNAKGWMQGGIISEMTSVFYFGNYSYISLTNNALALFGHQEKAPDDYYFSLSEAASIQYSNVMRAGPGRFERAGFMIGTGVGRRYDSYFSRPSEKLKDTYAFTASAAICIPHLLPFESKYGFTYNLPLTITASLLPSSSVYGYADTKEKSVGTAFIEGNAEATLFSVDIQKAIPVFTALYLNDLYISGGYAATGTAGSASKNGFQTAMLGDYFSALADGRGYYLSSAYLKTGLEFTPNIGMFAKSSFKMTVYSLLLYTINPVKELKPEECIRLTFGFNMNM